ncbi:DNA polymerase IV [Pilimelia columellifera]|uniref:DNA polymerase IV n=1 Tax=Pilimelia columellifera subsp. columellifera TaxID=706583 RepID=A0ABP6AK29_9ACTN
MGGIGGDGGIDPDSGSPILHVDMDAFFASVEVLARPELRGRPVVVGGVGPRGVVSSASYEARAYGVRSAMPTARARALCPRAVFLPPSFPAYQAASQALMEIFRSVTPLVEPLSLDEAFLDVSGARRLFGAPAAIAVTLRRRVNEQLGLPCSVGVAPTKFVAKVASARAKPDGMLVVPVGRVAEFLRPLPVRALWGVGGKAAERLRRLGLTTVGDVADAPPGLLRQGVGAAAANHLADLANGRDPRAVVPGRAERSISAETTFEHDCDLAGAQARRTLLALAGRVAVRLRAAALVGRTVAVKIRTPDFATMSRSRTLPRGTDVGREIFSVAQELTAEVTAAQSRPGGPLVRLVGVRVEGLTAADGQVEQLALGESGVESWREAERATDAAAARFGRSVVKPASLLPSPGGNQAENSRRRSVVPLSDPPPPS